MSSNIQAITKRSVSLFALMALHVVAGCGLLRDVQSNESLPVLGVDGLSDTRVCKYLISDHGFEFQRLRHEMSAATVLNLLVEHQSLILIEAFSYGGVGASLSYDYIVVVKDIADMDSASFPKNEQTVACSTEEWGHFRKQTEQILEDERVPECIGDEMSRMIMISLFDGGKWDQGVALNPSLVMYLGRNARSKLDEDETKLFKFCWLLQYAAKIGSDAKLGAGFLDELGNMSGAIEQHALQGQTCTMDIDM